jgi:hypothetical protein
MFPVASGRRPDSSMKNRYIDSAARAVLCAFAFVLVEWLFLATKPSFLTTWPVADRVFALFAGAMPFMLGALALHAIACLAAALASRLGHDRVATVLLRLVPALSIAAIALMLIDNFTYVVFGWGIARTTIATAIAYWIVLLAIVVAQSRKRPEPAAWTGTLAAAALVLSALSLAWLVRFGDQSNDARYRSARSGTLPNIILFASDGVNADFMSAYGSERKTTPNLDRYLDRALVADNAFTNSAWTTGSLTSMLTGKYPATTKVLFPPYTLQGKDSHESLPRILRALGYRTGQETVRYYADGPDLNFEGAFDYANGRTIPKELLGRFSLPLQRPRMLADDAAERFAQRILHLAQVEKMPDPHAQVAPEGGGNAKEITGVRVSDADRMRRIEQFMFAGPQPFFAHIHLLGTHCCTYQPPRRVFSTGDFATPAQRKQAELADAILESDRMFGQMMDSLERRGMLDNTIVVYTSDHNTRWDIRARVPLIFIFPRGDRSGHVAGNSQLLDVAPTLLDYLGVQVPEWMEGSSLLGADIGHARPVYSIYKLEKKTHFRTNANERLGRIEDIGPPTYGLYNAGLVVCQRWYTMRLSSHKVRSGKMARYVGKCKQGLPTRKQAEAMMTEHLRSRGFVF